MCAVDAEHRATTLAAGPFPPIGPDNSRLFECHTREPAADHVVISVNRAKLVSTLLRCAWNYIQRLVPRTGPQHYLSVRQ